MAAKDTQLNAELKWVLELVGQLIYNQKHARKSGHAGVVLKSMGSEASVAFNRFWVKGLTEELGIVFQCRVFW